jgi:hypothetical protein
MKKVVNKSKRGGARPGAGRHAGQTKTKFSISVDTKILNRAVKKWGGKSSPLIEKLLQDYSG